MKLTLQGLALFAVVASAPAQNLLVGDPGAGGYWESTGSSVLVGPLGTPVMPMPSLFPLPPGPPVPSPAGGMSYDGTTGLIWNSDGFAISAEPHVAYPGYSAPPIPPAPAPSVLAPPYTGLAIDSAAGILWITDGFMIEGLAAAPGLPTVALPFFAPLGIGGPLQGLDWDPVSGTFWGVDLAGFAWNFFPGGIPVGPPLPPPIAPPGPPAGIAVDKTGVVPPFGGGRPVYVVYPATIVEYTFGGVWPSFTFVPGLENGIAFHPAPSQFPGPGGCACPGMPFGEVPLGPAVSGNPAFGIDIVGLPPGTPVFQAFDFLGPNLAFPVVNGIGCPLGMTVAGIFGFGTFAGPGGTATFPFSLVGVPPGSTVYMQQIIPCAADPVLGLVLTNTSQVIVSAP